MKYIFSFFFTFLIATINLLAQTNLVSFFELADHDNSYYRLLKDYLQSIGINKDLINDNRKLKHKFNYSIPTDLVKPGSIEIQLRNNITQNYNDNSNPNYQYRTNSLQGKFGINPYINLGFLVNYEISYRNYKFDKLFSLGPQLYFKPNKNRNNFNIELGYMFPIIKEHEPFFIRDVTGTNGSSFYSKINFVEGLFFMFKFL